jgi:NADH:ubiquinone oxidoreductase subunit
VNGPVPSGQMHAISLPENLAQFAHYFVAEKRRDVNKLPRQWKKNAVNAVLGVFPCNGVTYVGRWGDLRLVLDSYDSWSGVTNPVD